MWNMRWFSFRKHPQINRSFKNFHSRLDHLVIFEDRHVIVANKPSGILSQQAQKGENTMIELLKSYIKLREKRDGDVFVAAINRLDRFTSGINLFARTSKGAKRLCEEFRCRYVKKKYICIVEGVTPSNQTLSHYLSNTRNQHQSLLRTNCSDKPETEYSEAKLIFTTIGNFSMKNKKLSLLEVILETGRKHQIRSQLSYIGHPIVGDNLYGSSILMGQDKKILYPCLHSSELKFVHPISKQSMTFKSLPPESWDKKLGHECSILISNYFNATSDQSK